MHKLLIATGSNLESSIGSPLETLESAVAMLDSRGIRVLAASRWRRAAAHPAGAGPDFVNGALLC